MKKAYRIKKEHEFQRVFQKGQSYANKRFVVYTIDRPDNYHFRIGISVGKKVGNAVERNRIKRKIRAAIYELQPKIKEQRDFIVIARPSAKELSMDEMKKNLIHVLKIANLIK